VEAVARALGRSPDDLLDLSVSLNPCAPAAWPLVRDAARTIARYPDPGEATALMADALGVPADRVLLTNGGAEAIALVAAEHPIGWVEEPEFSLYRRHLTAVRRGAPAWRSNPGNPLGRLAAPEDQAFVWDESFHPLATGHWTRGDDHSYRIGSLTKVWACPGLRLGYVIAPDAAARDALAARQPRWSVNALALAVVPGMLAETDLVGWAATIRSLRADLVDLLTAYGLSVGRSEGNWVLVAGAGHLRRPFAQRGVLVRDCTSFGLPGTVRIAVPDGSGLVRLAAALDDLGRS
jgi:histidinol-phosphate/aromatic aminotransferase/cobyric acid decarboxylase-like protein